MHLVKSACELLDGSPGKLHGAAVRESLLHGCSKCLTACWLDEQESSLFVIDQVQQLGHSIRGLQLLESLQLLVEDMAVGFIPLVKPSKLELLSSKPVFDSAPGAK